jgi:phage-related protein
MSEFNAGSIVGSLDLDRDPFTRGLEEARRQADEFSSRRHTSTLDVDTRVAAAEIDAFEQRLRDIRNPTIHPDVDTRVAAAELEALERRIQEVTRTRTVDIRINQQGTPGRGGGGAGGAGGGLGGILGSLALPTLIGSILPAIVPLTGAATGLSLALTSAFTQGALSLGIFAAVAKSDLTEVSKAMKKVGGDATKLPAQLQPVGKAIEQWHYAIAAFKQETNASVSGALVAGIHAIGSALPTLVPLVNATGSALKGAFGIFQQFLTGPTFKNFIDLTRRDIGPALTGMAQILSRVFTGLFRLFQVFNPLLAGIGREADKIAGKFAMWTFSPKFGVWVRGIYHDLVLLEPLAKAIGGAFMSLWHALGSGGGGAVTFLTTIFNTIKQLQPALTAIVQLFSPFQLLIEKLLPTLVPFVNLLGQLATAIIPLLDTTVAALVSGIGGILKVLSPVVRALTEFFDKIKPADKVLGIIIASFIGLKVALIAIRAAAAANPIILLLTALAVVAVLIVDHWKGFSRFWIKLWGDVSRFFVRIWHDIFDFLKQWGPLILAVLVPFIGIPLLIFQHWGAISHFFERIWNDIYGFFKKWGPLILAVLVPFLGIPLLIFQHWNQIVGWFKGIWNRVWSDIKQWWGDIESFFKGLGGKIVAIFSAAGSWLLRAGRNIMTGLWNGIKVVWKTIFDFYAKVYSVILHFFASAVNWLLRAGRDIITGLWNGIRTVWQTVYNFYASIYGTVLRFFGNAISWLVNAGKDILTGLWNGIKNVWDAVTGWFGNLWHHITDFFAGAGQWLIDAGRAILNGLWNGLKQVWNDLTGWIGGLGHWIKSHKGPIEADRVLLLDEGRAIMQGLHRGMRETFESLVKPYVTGLGGEMKAAFGDAGLSANATLTTAASVTLAGQAQQQAKMADQLDRMVAALQALPGATGDAVGSSVADKFDRATAKQTDSMIVALRTA